MKLDGRDIRLVAAFELRQAFRSPQGVLALCFLLLPLAWWMSKLAGNAETINDLAAGMTLMTPQQTFLLEVVKWFADFDEEVLTRLLVDHSPFVTGLFAMTVFAVPFLTMVASLDQNATDIGTKGIRFFLPRISRDNLLLGRFLGTLIFWSIGLALAGVAAVVLALVIDTNHGPALILLDGLWFTLGLIMAALPFVAFMALCSVTTGNPLLSITMGLGAYLAVFLMGGLGGWFHEGLKVIRFVFPSPLRYDLMLGEPVEVIVAAVAMAVYTVAFLVGACWIIRKRDL